jgi:hypothetical protein
VHARFALISALAAGLAAAAPPPGAPPREVPGPLEIRVRFADGKPVPSAVVRLGGRLAGSGAAGSLVLDGVPAGRHPIVVEHPAFARFEGTVGLAAGFRPPVEVALTASAPVTFGGKVLLEDGGDPVAGARLSLVPLAVAATLRGRFDFDADWDGAFKVLDAPPGRYRAEVRAAGCAVRSFDLDVAPAMPEAVFRVPRETAPASLTVTAQESADGRPVPNARVILAEAGLLGRIAEGRTGPDGRCAFPELKLGRLNWTDRAGTLAVARRQATVRIEADGFEPTIAPATLAPGATLAVPLPSLAAIAEREPNESAAEAQPIRTGAPVELKIDRAGDQDFFRFRLRHPAFLKLSLGPAGVLETYLRLLGSDGKAIREIGAGPNQVNRIDLGVPAGEYVVHVTEWGNNGASEKPLALKVECATAPDALEPNDAPAAARLLQSGEEARACILPLGDVDCFRFEMKRDGSARFRVAPHVLDRYLRILDESGRSRGEQGAGAGRPSDLLAALPAGRYVLEVAEWGNNGESPEPYALRFDAVEDEGVADPPERPGRLTALRTLEPVGLVGSTINPAGDVDLWAVATPSSGLLTLSMAAPIETYVRVRDGSGRVLAEAGFGPLARGVLQWSAPGSTVVHVEVTEWGNNGWSASPYTLRAWFEPGDELEFLDRNETPETATPAEPGDVLRGSICPYGDRDLHRIDLDHAGYFHLTGSAPTEVYVRILTAQKKLAVEAGFGPNAPIALGADLPAGECFVEVAEWGNNGSHVGAYGIATRLDRGDPEERAPLRDDPVRPLRLGEARGFTLDQFGDRDRFAVAVPQAGKYALSLRTSTETYVKVFDDQTGKGVAEYGVGPNSAHQLPIEAKGPTRYRVELYGWGDNDRGPVPGFVLLDVAGRALVAEALEIVVDPLDPTRITFARQALPGAAAAAKVGVDADGDGRVDLEVPPAGSSWRVGAEGILPAVVLMEGAGGERTVSRRWIEAIGPRERKGVRLLVDHPAEGQLIDRDLPVRARAVSYTGARIAAVTLEIDGRPAASAYSPPFQLDAPWSSLGAGRHEIAVSATDARGERATVRRTVQVSEYFDLQPEDGAVVTGNEIAVRWSGAFGPARVRLRPAGATEWKEITGGNAAHRNVPLADLDAGKPYEFQPVGTGEPGPVRTFTRVKGLAFGRPRYAAHLKRDYDQRVGVSVRNHGEKPLTVRLECGRPDDPSLLVGFVGEGSEGAPVPLGPGEERDFLLGVSAQDVKREVHRFPIRLASDAGFSDQAEVELRVKLPVVKLEWEALGATPSGLGRRFRLHNRGDALTDLDLVASDESVDLSPAVRHGLLPAGSSLEVTVQPRLHAGFTGAEATVSAHALDKSTAQEVKVALQEGQRLFAVPLMAGHGAGAKDHSHADVYAARAMAGAYLNPRRVDWSRRERPQDSDGDGRPDRWSLEDAVEGVVWSAEDHDGDGEIDLVLADVGGDGQVDYAAFRTKDGYEETNLVDAWLEMGFQLPWDRKAYEKHDVDLVMNGQVVGRLRDSIPEGSYSFRVPGKAFRFTAAGAADLNEVEIRSKHLRGGHYVVGSDFRLKARLTGARVWTAAATEEAAVRAARATEGLVTDRADLSVSSAEARLEGPSPLAKGADTVVTVPLRNVGAVRARNVAVALLRAEPGGRATELSRILVEDVPLAGEVPVRIPWKASAGNHSLTVAVDPDGDARDSSPGNNRAILSVSVPGDDAKPVLKLLQPAEGAALRETVVAIEAEASDDAGIERVEAQIDGGLWERLEGDGTWRGKALVQPGDRSVRVRAVDGGGNVVEQVRRLKVVAEAPALQIEEPAAGATIDARTALFRATVGPDAKLAAMRVNGGPWHRVPLREGAVRQNVPLPFGAVEVEVLAADGRGAVRRAKHAVRCGLQPAEPLRLDELFRKELPAGWDDSCVIPIDGLGEVDLAGPESRVLPAARKAPPPTVENPCPGPEAPEAVATSAEDPPAGDPEGGLVAVQQARSDWYCTNRPQIKVGFRLPDWIMKINLPKPGTKEYEEMEQRLLHCLHAKGINTGSFERFQKTLIQKARTLEGPEQLPGFLESVGLSGPAPVDEAGRKKWRDSMEAATHAWWLRLLSSCDPQLILDGLKARGSAFAQWDQALQENAQAIIEEIHAWQKLSEDVISSIPAIGDGFDLIAIATGESLSGEKVTALTIAFHALARLIPLGVGKLLERPAVKAALEAMVEKLSVMGKEGLEILAKKLGRSPEELQQMLEKVATELVKERTVFGRGLAEQTENAGKNFAKSAAGKLDRELLEKDLQAGRKIVQDLKEALDGGDPEKIKRAVANWQGDKTAQSILLNGRNLPDNLPKGELEKVWRQTNDKIKEIYDQVDDDVRKALRQDPRVIEAARKAGIDPATLDVDKMTITNVRPGSRSTPKPGRDRDVTYQMTGRGADGRPIRVDVDHTVSKGVYEENFFQRTKGGLPKNADGSVNRAALDANVRKEIEHHAETLDQTVTSRWHAEAYNPGEVKLNDFLNKGITPTITRAEDVRDTVIHKGRHWFEKARSAVDPAQASKDVAEGMRQTTKQWKDLVMSRVKQYQGEGMAGNLRVPPTLQRGMEIFEMVEKGAVTPKQAEAMLQAMGTTKEGMVDAVGNFFVAMEKGTGDAFRRVKGAELAENLSKMGNRGTTGHADAALEKINAALAGGNLTGERFLQLRQQVQRELVGAAASPAAKEAGVTWARDAARRGLISTAELGELLRHFGR